MKKMIILLFLASLFGLPRFSIEQESRCINCHVNPSGSGMRNDYGSNVYTLDELTMFPKNAYKECFGGGIADEIVKKL